MARRFDIRLKILLVGDSGVGKSCLMSQFVDNEFSGNYVETIGVAFRVKTFYVGGKRVKLEIWEISGNEKFRDMTTSFYHDADGVIVVYDVTSKESLENVNFWLREIETNCVAGVQQMLVGNKKDIEDRKVHLHDARSFAHQVKFRIHRFPLFL